MNDKIRGYILGQDGIGIPNLNVELLAADEQGNPLPDAKPILHTTSLFGGHFYLDLIMLPPGKELPEYAVIIFRNRYGDEKGRLRVTSEIKAGQTVRYETDLKAPSRIDFWSLPSSPPKLITEDIKQRMSLATYHGLTQQSSPQVSLFTKYLYFDPRDIINNVWPWVVKEEEIPEVSPLEQKYLLGLEIPYREEWHLLGYAKGELLHSIPLTPGEETTLEIYTWDRNIYKREEEISNDMERELEQNRQFKENREVFREMKKQNKWYVDAEVSGKYGCGLSYVQAKLSGGYSSEAQQSNRDTLNTLVDTTSNSANKVREQRKTSISSSREFGREERVTRKITNTNRCHTVNYHFYEILQNLKVKTQLTTPFTPCIFVKRKMDVTGESLRKIEAYQGQPFIEALQWVYKNSHLIAKSLLDRSFFRGLELVPDILASIMLKPASQVSDIDIDPYIRPYVRHVIEAVIKIRDEDTSIWGDFCFLISFCYFAQLINTYDSWIYELVLGKDQEDSLEWALNKDAPEKNDLTKSVKKFFEKWDPAFSNSSNRSTYESDNYNEYLYSHIQRLRREYAKWVYSTPTTDEATPEQIAHLKDLLEVTRLLNHIGDNFLHYCRAIWAAEDPADRLRDLSQYVLPGNIKLSEVIENKLLGYYANYAIFPFTYIFEDDKDYPILELKKAYEELPKDQWMINSFDVVLPTNGIEVESHLGESTACEPFIEKHRDHDLQQKELEVQKAELENKRRQEKINKQELDNPECCPTTKNDLSPSYDFCKWWEEWFKIWRQ